MNMLRKSYCFEGTYVIEDKNIVLDSISLHGIVEGKLTDKEIPYSVNVIGEKKILVPLELHKKYHVSFKKVVDENTTQNMLEAYLNLLNF